MGGIVGVLSTLLVWRMARSMGDCAGCGSASADGVIVGTLDVGAMSAAIGALADSASPAWDEQP